MVHELAGDGMLILWSTSYLDEAEQCRDVLLMNEGELLYQGDPTQLTQTMAGRSFLMSSPQENNRRLLQRALKLPLVSDGMIQGKSVRLILKKEATAQQIQNADGMPEITINETAPASKMPLSIYSAEPNIGIPAGRYPAYRRRHAWRNGDRSQSADQEVWRFCRDRPRRLFRTARRDFWSVRTQRCRQIHHL
jgi:hypothetical protein